MSSLAVDSSVVKRKERMATAAPAVPARKSRHPHITLNGDGLAVYRTKLLPRDRAVRFAACLSANERFLKAEVVQNRFGCHVEYIPANPIRQGALRGSIQASREARADASGAEYQFYADTDHRGMFWCLSDSGEVYQLTPSSCSCPDHEMRLAKTAGILCKHRIEANRRGIFDAEPLRPAAQIVPVQAAKCRWCDGTGKDVDWGSGDPCTKCGGSGRVAV